MNGTTISTFSRNEFNQLLNSQEDTKSMITAEEQSPSAHTYQKGNYLIFNNQLYKVTSAIEIGDTLSTSTNIILTNTGHELKATAGSGSGGEGEVITPPTVDVSGPVYNNTPRSPMFTGFDEDTMIVGQDPAITVGSYRASVALKNANNIWSDTNDSYPKMYTWNVLKAIGVISCSVDSLTLDENNLYLDITITVNSNATITTSISNTGTAQIEYISGNTYRISAVSLGTTTLSINAPATDNYTAASLSIPITVNYIDPVLNNNSWSAISAVSAIGTASSAWSIGDKKAIVLNGAIGDRLTLTNETLYVFIIGFDHNAEIEGYGISFSCFRTSDNKDVALIDGRYSKYVHGEKNFSMCHHATSSSGNIMTTYGGWKGCDLRYDILGSTNRAPSGYGSKPSSSRTGYDATSTCATNPVSNTLMAALPSDLRAVMKPITKYTDNSGHTQTAAGAVKASIDYLPLLAVCEVIGEDAAATRNGYNKTEIDYQQQYSYFISGNTFARYKYNDSTTYAYHWLRSPMAPKTSTGSIDTDKFACVSAAASGSMSHNGTIHSYGISPVFLI